MALNAALPALFAVAFASLAWLFPTGKVNPLTDLAASGFMRDDPKPVRRVCRSAWRASGCSNTQPGIWQQSADLPAHYAVDLRTACCTTLRPKSLPVNRFPKRHPVSTASGRAMPTRSPSGVCFLRTALLFA